jgi:protocatechuate 3,4-dioxygenase beta subunit
MGTFRIVAGLFAIALQLGAQQPGVPASSSIEGKIVDPTTDRPIADVRLTIEDAASGLIGSVTTSDDNGNFAFRNLLPGSYRITTIKDGYAPLKPDGRRAPTSGIVISVAREQQLREIVFRLLPQGVITGRIIDTNGSPVIGATVSALVSQPTYDEFGEKGFAIAGKTSRGTDDRGEFRIWALDPGEYQIRVLGTEGVPATIASYILYYPSGSDIARAQSIPVRSGEEVALPVIYAPVTETAPVRINLITDAPILPGHTRTMRFNREGVPMNVTVSTNAGPLDAIEHRGLPFGPNEVNVSLNTPQGVVYGKTTVNVGESDEKLNVNLVLKKGFRLVARVLQENADGTLQPVRGVNVLLLSMPDGVISVGGASDAEGTVNVASAPASEYRLRFFGLPSELSIARATQDGKDILSRKLSVSADTRVDILLKNGGRVITGVVRDSRGNPVSGSLVALVPSASSMRDHYDLYRSATTDQDGAFILRNVGSGDYKLFSWIEAGGAGAFRNAEFLAKYEERGKQIQISEDRNATADLQPVDEAQ